MLRDQIPSVIEGLPWNLAWNQGFFGFYSQLQMSIDSAIQFSLQTHIIETVYCDKILLKSKGFDEVLRVDRIHWNLDMSTMSALILPAPYN